MQTDVARRTMTAAEFEAYAALPENRDRRLELIEGEVCEVVSNDISSRLAMLIGAYITLYAEANNLGFVTGADGGFSVGDEHYMPDVAFMSANRQSGPTGLAWNPLAPDLAVEVLSPTDDLQDVRIKVTNYLSAGTTVWLVSPAQKRIEVHAPGKPVVIARPGDTLSGGDVLPGFTLAVAAIFPE
jgi:Uma2 family endonuclease